jgi:hypothetical protein
MVREILMAIHLANCDSYEGMLENVKKHRTGFKKSPIGDLMVGEWRNGDF